MRLLLIKSILCALSLAVLTFILNELMGKPHPVNYYLWSFPANLLVSLVLGYYVIHSRYNRILLCSMVFLIFFTIGFLNIMIEAWIFNVSDRVETANTIFAGLLLTLLFSPIVVYLFGKWKSSPRLLKFVPHTVFQWILKIAATTFLYFIIYLTAGITLSMVYPELLEFYENKIPPFELIFHTQLLRGLIFSGIAILIIRTTGLSKIKAALLIGGVFSIIGGIAPLIPPNELMPADIRLAHGFEVGISNFVYGLLAGFILVQKGSDVQSEPISQNIRKAPNLSRS